jgi:hypothetical protein
MPRKPSPFPDLRRRFAAVEERAGKFQVEGLPIPTAGFETEFDAAVRSGDVAAAESVVKRAEGLLARADQDWGWLRELLQRVDGLRGIADTVGLDLARIDARVGNPRAQLLGEPLTPLSLEKAAAGASFALAVLNDAIPKYIVQEAQALGVSIRRARDRGEEVREAVSAFSALLRSLQEPVLGTSAERLVEARRAVARIPRAPEVATVSVAAEDEILSEARNLARRLHRIKTKAHDAGDAVRFISQVRQALSEDRRYASPEEEVEALWAEVDRLTREKQLSSAGPPLGPIGGGPTGAAGREPAPDEPEEIGGPDLEEPDEDVEEEAEEDAGAPSEVGEDLASGPAETELPPVASRPAPVSRSAPPVVAPSPSSAPRAPPNPGPRSRPQPVNFLAPIVPPLTPVPDEGPVSPSASPDTLSEGAGPRVPRPTRIAIASAYVPPDLSSDAQETILPPPQGPPRRVRSRHHD